MNPLDKMELDILGPLSNLEDEVPGDPLQGPMGAVKGAWRGYIKPALSMPPPWLSGAPAQAYSGAVSGLTVENIQPNVKEPETAAEKISYEAGNLAGMGITVSAIASAQPFKNPAALGAMYGSLKPTGYSVGTGEDIKERAKNSAFDAGMFWSLGKASGILNERVAGPFLSKNFKALVADSGNKAAISHFISDSVLGAGMGGVGGAQEPAENMIERLKNISRGAGVGAVSFPLGSSISQNLRRGSVNRVREAQNTTVTDLNERYKGRTSPEDFSRPEPTTQEEWNQQIDEAHADKIMKGLGVFAEQKPGAIAAIYPESYTQGRAKVLQPWAGHMAGEIEDERISRMANSEAVNVNKSPDVDPQKKAAVVVNEHENGKNAEVLAEIRKRPELYDLWKKMPKAHQESIEKQVMGLSGDSERNKFKNMLASGELLEISDLFERSRHQTKLDDYLGKDDTVDMSDMPDRTQSAFKKMFDDPLIPDYIKTDISKAMTRLFPKVAAKKAAAESAVKEIRKGKDEIAKASGVPLGKGPASQDYLVAAKKLFDSVRMLPMKTQMAKIMAKYPMTRQPDIAAGKVALKIGLKDNIENRKLIRDWMDKEFDSKKLADIAQAIDLSDEGVNVKTKSKTIMEAAKEIAKDLSGDKKTVKVEVKKGPEDLAQAKAAKSDALKRLSSRMRSAGLSNEDWADLKIVAKSTYVEGKYKAKDFAAWSKKMVSDVGDWVKDHLKSLWDDMHKSLKPETIPVEVEDPNRRSLKKVRAGKDAVVGTDIKASVARADLNEKCAERAIKLSTMGLLRTGIDPKHLNDKTLWVVVKEDISPDTFVESVPLGKGITGTKQGLAFDLYTDIQRAYEDFDKGVGVMAAVNAETWGSFIKNKLGALDIYEGGNDLAEYGGKVYDYSLPVDGIYFKECVRKDVLASWLHKGILEEAVVGKIDSLGPIEFGPAYESAKGLKSLATMYRKYVVANLTSSEGTGTKSSQDFDTYLKDNVTTLARSDSNRNLRVIQVLNRAISGSLGEIAEANKLAMANKETNQYFYDTTEYKEFIRTHDPKAVLSMFVNYGLFKEGTTLESRVGNSLSENFSEKINTRLARKVAESVFTLDHIEGEVVQVPFEQYKSVLRNSDLFEMDPTQFDLQLNSFLMKTANQKSRPLTEADRDNLKKAGIGEEMHPLIERLNFDSEDAKLFRERAVFVGAAGLPVDLKSVNLGCKAFADALELYEKTGNKEGAVDAILADYASKRKRQIEIKESRAVEDSRFKELERKRDSHEIYESLVQQAEDVQSDTTLSASEKKARMVTIEKAMTKHKPLSPEELEEVETQLKEISPFEKVDYRKALHDVYMEDKQVLKSLEWKKMRFVMADYLRRFNIRSYDPNTNTKLWESGKPKFIKGGQFKKEGATAAEAVVEDTGYKKRRNEIEALDKTISALKEKLKATRNVIEPMIEFPKPDMTVGEKLAWLRRPSELKGKTFLSQSESREGVMESAGKRAAYQKMIEDIAPRIEGLEKQVASTVDPQQKAKLQEELEGLKNQVSEMAEQIEIERERMRKGFSVVESSIPNNNSRVIDIEKGSEPEIGTAAPEGYGQGWKEAEESALKEQKEESDAGDDGYLNSFVDPFTAALHYFGRKGWKGMKAYIKRVSKDPLAGVGDKEFQYAYTRKDVDIPSTPKNEAEVMAQRQKNADQRSGYVQGVDSFISGIRVGEAHKMGMQEQNRIFMDKFTPDYKNLFKVRLGASYVAPPKEKYEATSDKLTGRIGQVATKSWQYYRDVASGRYLEAKKTWQKNWEPIQRMHKLALEAVYIIDPETGKWAFTSTANDIDPISKLSKRQIWEEWCSDSDRRMLFKLGTTYRQIGLDAVRKGIFADADTFEELYKTHGYEHSIPIDKYTGKTFRGFRAFGLGEVYPTYDVTFTKGKTKKTLLERELDGPEIMDQSLTLRHYLEDYAERSSSVTMTDYWKTIMMEDGLPMFLHSTDKETAWGQKIDWDVAKKMRQSLGRDVPLSKYDAKAGNFDSAMVHPDLVKEFEGQFKYYRPYVAPGSSAWNLTRTLVKSMVLWPIFDNVQMLMAPLHGVLGTAEFFKAAKGSKEMPSVFSWNDQVLPEMRMRRAKAGVRVSSFENASKAFHDEYDMAEFQDVDIGKREAWRKVLTTFKMAGLDKFHIDRYIFKVMDNSSAYMFDKLSRKYEASGMRQQDADRLAGSVINEALFSTGKYTFSKGTGDIARQALISRNMAFCHIRWFTGASPWGNVNSDAPFAKWFTRNFGWRGYTQKEYALVQNTMASMLFKNYLLMGVGQSVLSYFLTSMNSEDGKGVWNHQRPREEWFKTHTGLKDSEGKEITWESPMSKSFKDNISFWSMFDPSRYGKREQFAYAINKADILTKTALESMTATEYRGAYNKELIYQGAPWNERVWKVTRHILGNTVLNPLKTQMDSLSGDPIKDKDLITTLVEFTGLKSGTTGVAPGVKGLEMLKMREDQNKLKYQKQKLDKAIDAAYKSGDMVEYNKLLSAKYQTSKGRKGDVQRRTQPYEYALERERKSFKAFKKFKNIDEALDLI